MMMALWKSPRAAGMHIRVPTLPPPPDSPKMVTFDGSPPKALILSRIHSSAWTMSSIPTIPECLYFSPKVDRSRNPRMFSRWLRLTTTTSCLARPIPGFPAAEPESNPPPWIHSITGLDALVSVVHTFSTQEFFSDITLSGISRRPFPCITCGPKWSQTITVSHFATGFGGMNRSTVA